MCSQVAKTGLGGEEDESKGTLGFLDPGSAGEANTLRTTSAGVHTGKATVLQLCGEWRVWQGQGRHAGWWDPNTVC